jgi:hypothetical protein
MRPIVIVAALVASTLPAAALDLPPRKAGLWELTMTIEGRELPPRVMQNCIDAETDKAMNNLGNSVNKDSCSEQHTTTPDGKIVIDSVCSAGQMTATTHSEVAGSFDSSYTMRVTAKTDSGIIPPTTSVTIIAAKWLGVCKADQRPGDIIMPNGMKVNISDLQQKMRDMRPADPTSHQ